MHTLFEKHYSIKSTLDTIFSDKAYIQKEVFCSAEENERGREVCLIETDSDSYVLTHQIKDDENFRHEIKYTRLFSEKGIAPEVIHQGKHFFMTRFFNGKPMNNPATEIDLINLARAVRLIHNINDADLLTQEIREEVFHDDKADRLLEKLGDDERFTPLKEVLEHARDIRHYIEPSCCCHNDLWAPNILIQDSVVKIIDWETTGLNDPLYELAYISTLLQLGSQQESTFLLSYFDREPTPQEICKILLFKQLVLAQAIIGKHLLMLESLDSLMNFASDRQELTDEKLDLSSPEAICILCQSALHAINSIQKHLTEEYPEVLRELTMAQRSELK